MRAFSIVPRGQEGNVSDAELATGSFGPHYDDQLDMYAQLINDDDVTEDELTTYFHSMQFGPQGDVEREYSPTEGATVYRDELGIPHIYADALDKAGFALGYVSAEDRMWEMDVFRHAARGTLSEFVGPGDDDAFLEMDIDTRREGYTEQEIQKMFDSLDEKFGPDGRAVQEGLVAYSDGVNAYIDELKTDPRSLSIVPSSTRRSSSPVPRHRHNGYRRTRCSSSCFSSGSSGRPPAESPTTRPSTLICRNAWAEGSAHARSTICCSRTSLVL
jgi:hypothetical protein